MHENKQKNPALPSIGAIFSMGLVGILARFAISSSTISDKMRGYPHFTSPLNDVREIKEMVYMYERTGQFYARPSQVGQSEMLLKLLVLLKQAF